MANALESFSSVFNGYLQTESDSDLRALKRVGTITGQPWDQILQSWQDTSNGTSSPGIDPAKQFTWYISTLRSIATVRSLVFELIGH